MQLFQKHQTTTFSLHFSSHQFIFQIDKMSGTRIGTVFKGMVGTCPLEVLINVNSFLYFVSHSIDLSICQVCDCLERKCRKRGMRKRISSHEDMLSKC